MVCIYYIHTESRLGLELEAVAFSIVLSLKTFRPSFFETANCRKWGYNCAHANIFPSFLLQESCLGSFLNSRLPIRAVLAPLSLLIVFSSQSAARTQTLFCQNGDIQDTFSSFNIFFSSFFSSKLKHLRFKSVFLFVSNVSK